MTTTFNEESLRFEFDDAWTVVKYVETPEYARIRNQTEAKGVDFVGLFAAGSSRFVIHLIEDKDFRGHRIENATRIRGGKLALEVAQKMRDTVAGMIGARRTSAETQPWERFAGALRRRRHEVKVVLWLERDRPPNRGATSQRDFRRMRRKTDLSVLTADLKKRSRWLGAMTLVVDQDSGLEGVTATNLPGTPRT